MDNVHKFPKAAKAPPAPAPAALEPNPEAVKLLDDLLAKAKTGELQGAAILWVDTENTAWQNLIVTDAFDGPVVVGRLKLFTDYLSALLRDE